MSNTTLTKPINTTLLILVMMVSAGHAQRYHIEVHEDLSDKTLDSKPIILLEPDVKYYQETQNGRVRKYTKSKEYLPDFIKYLNRSARKNDINLNVKDLENMVDEKPQFFQPISRFRKHLINVNSLQQHPLNREEGQSERDNPVRNVMVKPPQIHPSFSGISEAYQTPYFAVTAYNLFKDPNASNTVGLINAFQSDIKGFFYFIIADVRSGDIIYREVKSFEGEPDKLVLFNQLYDTFYYLKKSL